MAAVCGRHPGTSIEFIPGSFLKGFSDEEIELMADMSAAANRHLNWNTPAHQQGRPRAVPPPARGRPTWPAGGRPGRAALHGPERPDPAGLPRGYVYRALPGWGWLFELAVPERITGPRQTRRRVSGCGPRSTP